MENVSLKFKGAWKELGIEIMGYRIISNLKLQPNFQEYRPSAEFVRITKGKTIIMNYKEYFKEKLLRGEGLIYKDYFIFATEAMASSEAHKKFIKEYEMIENEYKSYLGGALYEALYDPYNFSFIKGLILSVEAGVMNEMTLEEKLLKYCKVDSINSIVSQIKKSA